jgi:hypothetical protein
MLSRYIGTMCLSAAALTACGNSDVTTTDGGTCVGHDCDGSALTDPEGGNIIFEYIYFDTELQAAFKLPTGVTTVNRVIAYFMNDQTPELNALPTGGKCNNLIATNGWPEYVGTPHTDLDVGTLEMTGKNTAGADVTISVAKQPKGTDAIGRAHDVFYQQINPVAANYLKFDSPYTVKFGGGGSGSSAIPATTFDAGLYLAANFDISSPGLEDNGPLVAGTDFTVHWTPSTTAGLPAGDEVNLITWLLDETGAPTHMCPVPMSQGSFTIPGTAITEYQAIAKARGLHPNKMILLRNGVIHQLRRLPNGSTTNKRRIDMLTLVCWAQLMDVQGTPP